MAGELLQQALQHHQAGRLAEAEAAYQALLRQEPKNADAQHFLGVIAYQRGDFAQAERLITQALAWQSGNAPAFSNLGNVLRALGRERDAIAAYRKALALQPAFPDALFNLAQAHQALGEAGEAVLAYRKAAALAPPAAHLHFFLGNALAALARHEEAVAAYRAALAIQPAFPEALSNLGNSLAVLGRLDEAAAACEQALELKPGFAAAFVNLGVARKRQGRHDEAARALRQALAADPNFAFAHSNLGNVLADLGEVDEARAAFERALALDPELAEARWAAAIAQMPAVFADGESPAERRAALAQSLEALERWLDAGRLARAAGAVGAMQPFFLAYREEDNRPLLERYGRLCARVMDDWTRRENIELPTRGRSNSFPGGVIRVGVVSNQFRHHSVWNAIVKGWFQKLDRKRFELHAFSLGGDEDAETHIARDAAASFTSKAGGVREWIQAIARRKPDVLIYPEIGMDPGALRLAALRLAPVQAASWGHPETSGLPTIDYYLSADGLESSGAQAYYTEKLVRLPHLGCYYQAAPSPGRADPPDLGVAADVPVLVCPGTPQKYAPEYDRLLTGIAKRLGRCRLVFFAPRAGAAGAKLRARLEAVFRREGLRLADYASFLSWLDPAAFHALLKRASLFLDTAGFSGFNTAMQSLECGLPLVTLEGRFLRGRLASGILRRMGMPELIAASPAAYVELVAKIVRDQGYRGELQGRIGRQRGVLFEDEAAIRGLEEFLEKAVRG